MTQQRNWRPFPLTTPVTRANNPGIDPRPHETAAKHARLKGKGTAMLRAGDKVNLR